MSKSLKNWWEPTELKRIENNIRNKSNVSSINHGDSFASYKSMLKTNNLVKSNIKFHNDISPSIKISIIKQIIEANFNPLKILDVGCGLGFTTNELKKKFPHADVVGIDISLEAIQFAKFNFKKSNFKVICIDPKQDNLGNNYDLILASEFYPFTRTSDTNKNRDYLLHFLNSLSHSGNLILFQRKDNPDSIFVNLTNLKKNLKIISFLNMVSYKNDL